MRILLTGVLLLFGTMLQAHESRPFYIELIQHTEQRYQLCQKFPPSLPANNLPQLLMPASCTRVAGRDHLQQWYECAEPLDGQALRIHYPSANPSVSTLIRLQRNQGEVQTALLPPGQTRWQVPAGESVSGVLSQYTRLGVQHILAGYDHLLFVACLLFIAGNLSRIVVTLTGFTLAHSLTLALAAVGWLRLPIPAVEAVIALSIVFLARELLRDRRDTLTWRYPITVASSFGLLHGLGFAAVLGEIGLPQTQVVAALVSFNLGVELGQLLFALGVVLVFRLLRWLDGRTRSARLLSSPALQPVIVYGVGGLATLWLFERVGSFF